MKNLFLLSLVGSFLFLSACGFEPEVTTSSTTKSVLPTGGGGASPSTDLGDSSSSTTTLGARKTCSELYEACLAWAKVAHDICMKRANGPISTGRCSSDYQMMQLDCFNKVLEECKKDR